MQAFKKYWRWVWEQALSPQVDQKAIKHHLEKARRSMPTPLFWLLGKSQSGKTSIIRALTGSTKAAVGNGFRACTKSASVYAFPTEEEVFLRFLDTRGLGEVHYDPSDDIRAFAEQAHLVLVVMKAMDHAQRCIVEPLRQVRKAHPNWPVIVVQTCLHEGYRTPHMPHLMPYPFGGGALPGALPEDLRRSLTAQRDWFAGESVRFVPVDFTQPEDGFQPETYGVEALWEAIHASVPDGVWAMLREMRAVRKRLSNEFFRVAHRQVLAHSFVAAGAGAIPVPTIDLSLTLAVQAKMFHALASVYRQPISVARMAEVSSALGTGFLFRYAGKFVLRWPLKLFPPLGTPVGAAFSGASTYALGQVLCVYFSRVQAGDQPRPEELRRLYKEHFCRAKDWKSWSHLAQSVPLTLPQDSPS